jgi:putative ABC transport system permease protein
MYKVALQMLFGDRGKYLGIIIGIAMSSIIIIQQPSILVTMLSHTYSLITDISLPDIRVMDPKVRTSEDSRPLWTPSSTGGGAARAWNGPCPCTRAA